MSELEYYKGALKRQIAFTDKKVKELEEQLARIKFVNRIDTSPAQPNHHEVPEDKDFDI